MLEKDIRIKKFFLVKVKKKRFTSYFLITEKSNTNKRKNKRKNFKIHVYHILLLHFKRSILSQI